MSVASAGDLCGTLFKHYPLGHCYAELQSHNVGTVVKIHLQRYCRPGAKRDIGGRDGVSLRKTPNGVSSMRSNIEIIRLVDILLIFGYFNVIL